jgi:hypothetical protein
MEFCVGPSGPPQRCADVSAGVAACGWPTGRLLLGTTATNAPGRSPQTDTGLTIGSASRLTDSRPRSNSTGHARGGKEARYSTTRIGTLGREYWPFRASDPIKEPLLIRSGSASVVSCGQSQGSGVARPRTGSYVGNPDNAASSHTWRQEPARDCGAALSRRRPIFAAGKISSARGPRYCSTASEKLLSRVRGVIAPA